ncbi:MAG: acyl-CoA/acyl-ACP dehydrogenase [Deltaproteobacteria bacterium]|nr:acyl-CoA/acyl-ACP dehydrogenase [Deltaproteobacteria bacterium]
MSIVPEKLESIAAIAATHAADVDRGAFPTQTLDALRAAGLLGFTTLPDAQIVVERLARECGSTAMVVCMHYCGAAVIEKHGADDVVQQVGAGELLATLAFSEPGSRSHFWAPIGIAKTDGKDVLLTARKSWVTSAHKADVLVWSSKPLAGTEMSTLWLVPRTTPGLRISDAQFDGIGLRGNDSVPVTAEDARIPATSMLGDDGAGFGIMMGVVLPWFNVLCASVSAGLMEAATTRTAAHAGGTTFQHAGSTVADLPTVRAFIARMRIQTDQTKTLIADTLAAMGSNRADTMLRVLESKAAAGESAAQVTDLAMRVCGGTAFRKEVGVERIFRDSRAALVMGPTTDVLYDFIGKAVCGQPLF